MEIPHTLEAWSWIAGIAGALSGIYTIFKPRKNPTEKSQKLLQEAEVLNNTNIQKNTGNITINNNSIISNYENSKDINNKVDIHGRWDLEEARKICEEILVSTDWSKIDPSIYPPISHCFVNVYFPIYKEKEEAILIYGTKNQGDDCHVCAPHLSIFEFTKKDAGWKLSTYDIAAFQAGSWGEAPNISVLVIGNEKYAIQMEHGYMAQGWIMGSISLHAKIGDSFKEIFTLATCEYDPDGNGWNSKIKTTIANTGLYIIEVIRNGTRGDEDLKFLNAAHESLMSNVADYSGNIRKSDKYIFDGIRYVLTE